MGRRALGIGLGLLTVALWVGPVVMAFGSHNWNLKDTVMPGRGQIEKVQNRIEGLMGEGLLSEEAFSAPQVTRDGSVLSLRINFSSPFDFTMKIEEFRLKLYDEDEDAALAHLEMADERVEIGANETETLRLTGTLTEQGEGYLHDLEGGELPGDIGFSVTVFKFEVYGVLIEISPENMGGGGPNLGRMEEPPGA